MLKSQKIALELSEKRQKINELLAKDELTSEERSELEVLTSRMQEAEVEFRAAVTTEGTPEETAGSEDRELAQLVIGASIGSIFAAAIEHRTTSGQTAELQQHFKIASNQIPLVLFRDREVEERATGTTPAPTNVGQNQAAIIPAVFPLSCAAFLGVDMPTVGVGEAVYPVLTTSADVGVPAENAEQDETAGAFSADALSPARLQASFFYSREDRARFVGMDNALRANLSDALSDKLDQQILAGDEGLLHSTNLANHNVTVVTSYALYRSQFAYGRVDGKYASATSDLKVVMGTGTYSHAAGQYRGNSDNMDALMALTNATAGVKVSAHIPAVSGNKQNAVVRLGMRRDMVAPIWEGITLIPDEISLAKKGQIQITAVMLHAIKILRSAGFYKQQSQHA